MPNNSVDLRGQTHFEKPVRAAVLQSRAGLLGKQVQF